MIPVHHIDNHSHWVFKNPKNSLFVSTYIMGIFIGKGPLFNMKLKSVKAQYWDKHLQAIFVVLNCESSIENEMYKSGGNFYLV